MMATERRWWVKGWDNWPLYGEARWTFSDFYWGTPAEAQAWQRTLRKPLDFEMAQLWWWDPSRRAWRTYWDTGEVGDLGRDLARNMPEYVEQGQALFWLAAFVAAGLVFAGKVARR